MPSAARANFERHLLRDVDALIVYHRQEFPGRGRPHSIFTRSGTFLLCAAWELYCEEAISESLEKILDAVELPGDLPPDVRGLLISSVRSDKDESTPLRLAGEGWRDYLRKVVQREVGRLNTPKKSNVVDLFRRCVGVDVNDLLNPHEQALHDFISKRGDIAHRGADAGHVSINDLAADYDFIRMLVRDIDNFIIQPIQQVTHHRPWNRAE
jgi:hypothetical protein